MSLINEALKRAEEEKLSRGSLGGEHPTLPPVRDAGRLRAGSPIGIVLICLTMITGLVMGWNTLNREHFRLPPQAVAAESIALQPNFNVSPAPALDAIVDRIPLVPIEIAPTAKAPAESNASEDDEKTDAQTAAAPLEDPPPTRPAPREAAGPKPKADPSKYKLSGILHNVDGGAAIINGYFVRTGQVVDSAEIIVIQTHAVELELDGERFTIRM